MNCQYLCKEYKEKKTKITIQKSCLVKMMIVKNQNLFQNHYAKNHIFILTKMMNWRIAINANYNLHNE